MENIAEKDDHLFDNTVAVRIEGEWWHITNALEAIECLQHHFPDRLDASVIRSISTCNLLLERKVSVASAESAFIVAAMAAGLPFETGDHDELLEIEVGKAIDEGLRELLFNKDDGVAQHD